MRWTERQQQLLHAMGLKPWGPAQPVPGAVSSAEPGGQSPAMAPDADPGAAGAGPRAAPIRPAGPAERAPSSAQRPTGRPADTPSRMPAGERSSGAGEPALPVGSAALGSAALASADWPALREAVAGCQACPLARSRRQTVFGVGHERARLMVVGEAPGAEEDRKGEPFVGPAGQLLDRMLAAIGWSRSADRPERQVFIANTLKCRPPGNRNPTPEEMACCAPFLDRQLALVQPSVVLAMGRFAVQSLLKSDEPIGRLRGRVHDWQGRPLVVTYHPAYLLRQPSEKARAWDDLCRVADLLDADGQRPSAS